MVRVFVSRVTFKRPTWSILYNFGLGTVNGDPLQIGDISQTLMLRFQEFKLGIQGSQKKKRLTYPKVQNDQNYVKKMILNILSVAKTLNILQVGDITISELYMLHGEKFRTVTRHNTRPQGYKTFSSSAQLGLKFQLLINAEIIKICGKFRFNTQQLVICLAHKC